MPGVARFGDPVSCPADVHGWTTFPTTGLFVEGSPDVFCDDLPVVRVGDGGVHVACAGPNTFTAAVGAPDVLVNDQPAAFGGSATLHCGLSPGTTVPGLTSFSALVND